MDATGKISLHAGNEAGFNVKQYGFSISKMDSAFVVGPGRGNRHARRIGRLAVAYGVPQRALSESFRVLAAPHGHVHDSGRAMHAELFVLRGGAWAAGKCRRG